MRIEEILDALNLIESINPDYVLGRRRGLTDEESEILPIKALTEAEEILEKHLPQKPIKKNDASYICPICNRNLSGNENYCSNCGQRIDWS